MYYMEDDMDRIIEHKIRDEKITFIETSAETDGARTLINVELGPAKSAPSHRHVEQTEAKVDFGRRSIGIGPFVGLDVGQRAVVRGS